MLHGAKVCIKYLRFWHCEILLNFDLLLPFLVTIYNYYVDPLLNSCWAWQSCLKNHVTLFSPASLKDTFSTLALRKRRFSSIFFLFSSFFSRPRFLVKSLTEKKVFSLFDWLPEKIKSVLVSGMWNDKKSLLPLILHFKKHDLTCFCHLPKIHKRFNRLSKRFQNVSKRFYPSTKKN